MRAVPLLATGVPRRVLAGGLLGTVLLAAGGVGVGAVPRHRDALAALLGIQSLHRSYTGRWFALTLVLAGLLLLGGAWWLVGRRLDRLTPAAVRKVAALWSLPLLVAPPLFSRDVYLYAAQGHLAAHGIDPYTHGPDALAGAFSDGIDPVWNGLPSLYGPVFLWLAGRIVAVTGDSVVPAVLLLRLLAVAGLVLVGWGLPVLARAHGVPPQRALWLGLANPLVLLHGIGGAHNDALMVGLLVAGLAVAGPTGTGAGTSTRRLALAAALVATAALVKVPAVAALVFLPLGAGHGWRVRGRAAAVVGGTAVLTGLAWTAVSGLGWGWVRAVDAGSVRLSVFSPVTGVGVLLAHLLRAVGLVQDPDVVLRLVLAAGLLASGILAVSLMVRAGRLGPVRALGLTLVAVVALGPVAQPWYLLWGLVLLAAVGGERAVLALGALSLALCLALMPNGRSLVRPPLYGVPVLAAVALAVVAVRRSTRSVLATERLPA